jgi:uncharacterized protein YyaL (SSP411 family)
MPNRLAGTKSPYLQQHADNPVDWYPWCEEALARARAEDKPILVSIGYSSCHWCHVMAHESFENPAIAELMNNNFINIKVDREERPDIDSVYMEAVQMLTGHGGWPLNVFLTPDLKPFFGGTYWPPTPKHGLPSWPQVLQAIALAWRNEREKVLASADQLTSYLGAAQTVQPSNQMLSLDLLDQAWQRMRDRFDWTNGGFDGAPKFPQAMNLEFLLRTYKRISQQEPLAMVELTLQRMATGGIYDHLGGGFHRYTVDAAWTVPHFEKMLYDNALLSQLYVYAWQVTGLEVYRRVAEGVLDYVKRAMTSPEGGFYSAEDADSEGEEGKFYVWRTDEIVEALGEEDAAIFMRYYGVTEEGNFEGKNVLTISSSIDQLAREFSMAEDEVRTTLQRGRERLFAVREQRPRPGRDDKILTSWNALMLRAFALAGRIFNRVEYLDIARRNADFLLSSLRQGSTLLHFYKQEPGEVEAFLDDYAYLIEALITLYETVFELHWLEEAKTLADRMIESFADEVHGGFFDTAHHQSLQLPVRPKTLFDSAVPSGNATASAALLRLAALTGENRYERYGLGPLRLVRDALTKQPLALGKMLCALDFYLATPHEIAIIGDPARADTRALLDIVFQRFLPNTVIAVSPPAQVQAASNLVPLLSGRSVLDGKATAYVCERYTCKLPVTTADALAAQLSS